MNQPKYLDEAFAKICEDLKLVFIRKHRDYGKGNILSIRELGIAMRISEKTERLKHLLMTRQLPQNKSLDDAWTDIAVYAVIAKLLKDGSFEKLEMSPGFA